MGCWPRELLSPGFFAGREIHQLRNGVVKSETVGFAGPAIPSAPFPSLCGKLLHSVIVCVKCSIKMYSFM